MTREGKQLLLKEFCARLPYRLNVKVGQISYPVELDIQMLSEIKNNNWYGYPIPYLRSTFSMTDEERYELRSIFNQDIDFDEVGIHILSRDCNRLSYLELQAIANFFYSHHLDWCGMIPKRMALEAPENMYKEQNMKYERE